MQLYLMQMSITITITSSILPYAKDIFKSQ